MRGDAVLDREASQQLRSLYTKARNLYFELSMCSDVEIRWISREQNKIADALAKHAAHGFLVPWTAFASAVIPEWLQRVMEQDGFLLGQ